MSQTAVALQEGGGAMGLLIFLRGAVQILKSGLNTLCGTDPDRLLGISLSRKNRSAISSRVQPVTSIVSP
jgi:hypothetical protein